MASPAAETFLRLHFHIHPSLDEQAYRSAVEIAGALTRCGCVWWPWVLVPEGQSQRRDIGKQCSVIGANSYLPIQPAQQDWTSQPKSALPP